MLTEQEIRDNLQEVEENICKAAAKAGSVTGVELVPAAVRAFRGSYIAVGAQDLSEKPSGARTGETSGAQLRDAGAKYVIVGHSERRQYQGETDAVAGRKLRAAHDQGLSPILCVGETLEQREAGIERELIRMQLKLALGDLPEELMRRTVIAYEAIWAIGTGRTATPDQAQEVHALIRKTLGELVGIEAADAVRIQYGGSMKPNNAAELLAQKDIDGGLIGGAALKADSFAAIIEAAAKA